MSCTQDHCQYHVFTKRPACRVWARKNSCRWTAYRNRRRQSHRGGRADAGGFPALAESGTAAKPGRILAQPSALFLRLQRSFRRPSPARRRAWMKPRNDQVYELEIAFQQIPEGFAPPWMVDRVFRNLLVDSTGNTHRAEFCIDKLYSPEVHGRAAGLAGDAGVRDAAPRAHQPDAASVAALPDRPVLEGDPYREQLVRWRTEIHDRLLLPYFIRQDLEDVVAEVNQAGCRFGSSGSRRTSSSAFPCTARSNIAGSNWNCGRRLSRGTCWAKSQSGGTARYVDSVPRSGCRCWSTEWSIRGTWSSATATRCRCSPTGTNWPVRGRRALPRLAAAELFASDHRCPRAAGIRSGGHLVGPVHRRMHLSRCASGRTELRSFPGERLRGGEPPHGTVLQVRPHAWAYGRGRGNNRQGISIYSGSARAIEPDPGYAQPAASRYIRHQS